MVVARKGLFWIEIFCQQEPFGLSLSKPPTALRPFDTLRTGTLSVNGSYF